MGKPDEPADDNGARLAEEIEELSAVLVALGQRTATPLCIGAAEFISRRWSFYRRIRDAR